MNNTLNACISIAILLVTMQYTYANNNYQYTASNTEMCVPFWLQNQQLTPYHQDTKFINTYSSNEQPVNLNDLTKDSKQSSWATRKKIYKDKSENLWMLDFSNADINRYITAGLYKLILQDNAADEQLVKDDNKVIMGSKFLDNFSSFESFIIAHQGSQEADLDYQQKCLANHNCLNIAFDNVSKTVAAMVLLNERDAHDLNVGFVCDTKMENCNFGKVDHDSSKIQSILELANKNLKKLASDLVSFSYCRHFYDDVLQNSYDLASGMEQIASIPDDIWRNKIVDRINSFIATTGKEVLQNDLLERYMLIKKQAPYFAQSLYLEGAILHDDIHLLQKLLSFGINADEKYSYITINTDGLPITPLEMTVFANKKQCFEYLYEKSNQQTRILGVAATIKNHNSDFFNFFIERNPSILDSKELFHTSLRYNNNDVFQLFIKKGTVSINDNNVLKEVLENDSSTIYESLDNITPFTNDELLSHFKSLLPSFSDGNDNKVLYTILKKLSKDKEILKRVIEMFPNSDAFRTRLVHLLQDDDFFINLALKKNNNGNDLALFILCNQVDIFNNPNIAFPKMLYALLEHDTTSTSGRFFEYTAKKCSKEEVAKFLSYAIKKHGLDNQRIINIYQKIKSAYRYDEQGDSYLFSSLLPFFLEDPLKTIKTASKNKLFTIEEYALFLSEAAKLPKMTENNLMEVMAVMKNILLYHIAKEEFIPSNYFINDNLLKHEITEKLSQCMCKFITLHCNLDVSHYINKKSIQIENFFCSHNQISTTAVKTTRR